MKLLKSFILFWFPPVTKLSARESWLEVQAAKAAHEARSRIIARRMQKCLFASAAARAEMAKNAGTKIG